MTPDQLRSLQTLMMAVANCMRTDKSADVKLGDAEKFPPYLPSLQQLSDDLLDCFFANGGKPWDLTNL
jgi:hypothetical protein